ncbi:unnamed protein product [Echinostoma caproni]|uniref:NPH3 domain-containing protein n=1 Tax=Echinostoma caproni TaxID=27848 RepID=A0A183B2C4_9TREM|nr:unnamed protein product [Echinostoma caproni]
MKKLEIRQKQLDLEIATLHDEEHSLGGDDDYGDEVMERLEHVKDYVNLLPADRPLPNTTMSSNKTTHTARRLPELSLVSFDGTPRKLWRFLNSFKQDVAAHLGTDRERLAYLIHCCTGEAREAIEECVLLPEDIGYIRALSILESQFGCPDEVAENLLDGLLHGNKLRTSDIHGLRKLIRQVVNSEIILQQMGYASILNCPTTIKGVIRRIPEYMQLKWADEMTSSRLQGTKLLFRDLIAFLENCLSTATYCYGQGAGRFQEDGKKRGESNT